MRMHSCPIWLAVLLVACGGEAAGSRGEGDSGLAADAGGLADAAAPADAGGDDRAQWRELLRDAAEAPATFESCPAPRPFPALPPLPGAVASPCDEVSCPGHTHCEVRDDGVRCRCDAGWGGPECDRCADGHLARDGDCVTPCEAAGEPCEAPSCAGSVEEPICGCPAGFVDPSESGCQQCAEGFTPDPDVDDALGCIPICGEGCAALERCEIGASDEQVCECAPGYHRDDSGECVFDGLLPDPTFEQGCAAWRLDALQTDPDAEVRAELADGTLALSVSHVCDMATAVSNAKFPAPRTVPGAALRFDARGEPGSELHVLLSDPTALGVFPLPAPTFGAETFEGDGEWATHSLCLEGGPRLAAIGFRVGQSGACAEELQHAFEVRNLALVSDASCSR